MLATFAALLPLLPGFLLNLLKSRQDHKLALATDEERTRREATLALIVAEQDRRRVRSEERRHAMDFRAFWIPWLIAAIPAAAWFAVGILSSIEISGFRPAVVALEMPPQLMETYRTVMVALFGSGAGAVGLQTIAKALMRR